MAASFLGWSLDAFDFFLLVFVLKDIAAEFGTDITTITLGDPADAGDAGRWAPSSSAAPPTASGAVRSLMVDILVYSILDFASGFSPNLTAC